MLAAPGVSELIGLLAATAETEPTEAKPLAGAHPRVARVSGRGDGLAIALYRFLELRPVADIEYVFAAAVARRASIKPSLSEAALGAADGPEAGGRVERARASLLAASTELGRLPSRRDYDRWRDAKPRPERFASASFIRRLSNGSWTEALGQIGAPAADSSARRLLSNGRAFTDADRERAWRLFAANVPADQRTRANYAKWAKQYVLRDGAFDVPVAVATLTRGSGRRWRELLAALQADEDRGLLGAICAEQAEEDAPQRQTHATPPQGRGPAAR